MPTLTLSEDQVIALSRLLLPDETATLDSADVLLSAAESAIGDARNHALAFKDDLDAKTLELSAATEQAATLQSKLVELSATVPEPTSPRGDVIELSRPNDLVAEMIRENADGKLDLLVAKGKLSKASADAARARFIGERGDLNMVMLSNATGAKPLVHAVLDFIDTEYAPGVPLNASPKTGAQIELARAVPDDVPANKELPYKRQAARYNDAASAT